MIMGCNENLQDETIDTNIRKSESKRTCKECNFEESARDVYGKKLNENNLATEIKKKN